METPEGFNTRWQLVAFVAALVAIFSRQPAFFLHPQFFAEDGWVWYQQAYNLGWLRALGIAQAGYLQTFPRLAAGIALLFPMRYAPLIMNLVGAVIQGLPVCALLSPRGAAFGRLPVRLWMAALYLAIPNAPEIHVVVTNAMWHLALLQALVAFSLPPHTAIGRTGDVLLFAVGSVSGPFCLLLLPLVAAYGWLRRQRWTWVVLGILGIGGLLQVSTMLHAVRAAGAPLGMTPLRLLRIVAGDIFLDSMLGSGGPYLGVIVLTVAAIGGCLVVVWGWRSATLSGRLCCGFAVLVLMASLRDPLVLPGSMPRWEVLARATNIRYWFFPSLAFLWLALWCAYAKRNIVRAAGVSVLVLAVFGVLREWRYPPWPPSQFPEQAERFASLKSGESMSFPVYDPGGRIMVLVKR